MEEASSPTLQHHHASAILHPVNVNLPISMPAFGLEYVSIKAQGAMIRHAGRRNQQRVSPSASLTLFPL
jgi:hypothetical protein